MEIFYFHHSVIIIIQMNSNWKKIILLILVVVLATFLRLYNLPATPPGLYPDEAMNGNNGLEAIKTGNYKIFYPENNGREGLFINIQAFFLKLLIPQNGYPEPWMLRFPSALFGILTVIGVYFLTKELFKNYHGEQIALLAAFLFTTSFWHINFSRIGFRAIMAPAFLIWGLYFLLAALNKIKNITVSSDNPKNHNLKFIILIILGGIFYGLGFHSYIAYRATPVLILFVFILFWFTNKASVIRRKIFLAACLFSLFTLIAITPLVLYFLSNPADFFGRTTQVSIFASQSPAKDLIFNIVRTAGMFNFAGDWNWRHNIAGRPLLFLPVGIMFLIGFLAPIKNLIQICISKFENIPPKTNSKTLYFAFCILIFWLIVAALPVVISNEGLPHALRSILMAPPVLILAALGGIYFYDWLAKKLSKKMLLVFCSLLFAILITEAYSSYFYSWGRNNEVKNAFSQNYVEIGRMLNGLPRELPKYVVVQEGGVPVRGLPMPTQTVMFITDTFLPKEQSQKNIFYILPSQKEGLPPNAITINLN